MLCRWSFIYSLAYRLLLMHCKITVTYMWNKNTFKFSEVLSHLSNSYLSDVTESSSVDTFNINIEKIWEIRDFF